MSSAEALVSELHEASEADTRPEFPNGWLLGVVIIDVKPPPPGMLLVKRRSNQLIIPHTPYALNDERQQIT
jgi:hypothetical protein